MQEKEILSDHCKNLTTEYDPHFGQEVFAEESGVHIPIEIYEGCEYMFVFCCLSHVCKFGKKIFHGAQPGRAGTWSLALYEYVVLY